VFSQHLFSLRFPTLSEAAPARVSEKEMVSLEYIPIAENGAERPHSVVAHVARSAKASSLPWLASTLRLEEDLELAEALGVAGVRFA
jgi:hypothetical protein